MAKRVMLAVAGAGKTYNICNSINPKSKNLILAYTNENIHNINNELIAAFGMVPQLTNVMTFDSFIYRYILCPFEPTILKFFNEKNFVRKGITIISAPNKKIKVRDKYYANKKYKTKYEFGHYETNGLHYCDNISELIMLVKEGRKKLIDKAASAIDMFYEHIYIDEFQDFRGYDYELIIRLAKGVKNITLVGDYYQHSVLGQNNTGKPFKNKKDNVTYDEYLEILYKEKFEVDTETLVASRRCPKNICDFVRKKLGINIKHNNEHFGKVYWVDKDNIKKVLEDDKIIKLVYKNSNKYKFRSLNWSYSKGDTFDQVCVILTEKFNNLDDENFRCQNENIEQITINKFYVALTRTKGNLYLVKKDVFDTVKVEYCK